MRVHVHKLDNRNRENRKMSTFDTSNRERGGGERGRRESQSSHLYFVLWSNLYITI